MRGAIICLVACTIGLSASGCYPDPIPLEINYPFDATFLYSQTADLYMFQAEDRTVCPDLIDYVVLGIGEERHALQERQDVPVCDLRNGGFMFDDVGEGLRAFVVVSRDEFGRALLSGCVVEQTAVGADTITLNLSTTERYNQYTEEIGDLLCDSVEEKCTRGC